VHLVDKDGELILVHCVDYPTDDYFDGRYTAYRVNLEKRNMEPMPRLGRHTVHGHGSFTNLDDEREGFSVHHGEHRVCVL
jgi:hypothetical protein